LPVSLFSSIKPGARTLEGRTGQSRQRMSIEENFNVTGNLVGGTLLTVAILVYVLRRGTATTAVSQSLVAILIFLVAVELLMLPVNYGVLISTQQLP
jgi:uncharacterized membrane protein